MTNEDQNEEEGEDENKPLATSMIPYMYIKGLSEVVRRILQKYNIRMPFKTTNILGCMLTISTSVKQEEP